MSRDWDAIEGFDGWAAALAEILDEASAATRAGDAAACIRAQRELDRFVDHSPDAVARRLDSVARGAIDDLFLAVVEQRAAAIARRTDDLRAIVAQVRAVTGRAEGDAASIRLERVDRAVDALSGTIDALEGVRASLAGDAAVAEVLARVEALLAQAREVKDSLEVPR